MSQKKAWSKEDKDIILRLHPNLSEMAAALPERTTSAISQQVNKMGLSLRNRRWTKYEDDIMQREYRSGVTREISYKLKRSESAIVLRAKHLGLEKDNSVYRNTKCWKLLDGSLPSMYWIGFILADGHITANYKLKIALSSCDKSHLEKLAEHINANVHVKPYGKNSFNVTGEQCYISVKDVDNIRKLAEVYQIYKNKTEYPPKFETYSLTELQWLALIVGFIDGDGSITDAKRVSSPVNIRFKNHKSWLGNLEFIRSILCRWADVQSRMEAKLNSKGYSCLTVTDSRIIVGLKNFILSNDIPALTRKWARVDENYSTVRNKLNASEIREIERSCIAGNRINKSELSRNYGVSISAITTVVNRVLRNS